VDEKPTRQNVTVERRYRPNEVSCREAIRLLLDYRKKEAAEPTSEPNDRNDAAIVRHKEGANHVEQ
jgi:hypothetical protein